MANNGYLNQKIERIQYNATVAITGAVIGTYQSSVNNALDPESLKFRCWFRYTFYETKTTGVPQYLSDLIPQANHLYNICVGEDVITLYSRTDLSSILSFNTVLERSKLDCNIQQSRTMPAVLDWLTIPKWIYNIYNPTGLTIPNRLRLGLSHLN